MDTAVQPLLILGTHFFAPEVLDLISETPGFRVDGFVENLDRERTTEPLAGLHVHWIDDVVGFAPTHRAVCALGTTKRRRLIEEALRLGSALRRSCIRRRASRRGARSARERSQASA